MYLGIVIFYTRYQKQGNSDRHNKNVLIPTAFMAVEIKTLARVCLKMQFLQIARFTSQVICPKGNRTSCRKQF